MAFSLRPLICVRKIQLLDKTNAPWGKKLRSGSSVLLDPDQMSNPAQRTQTLFSTSRDGLSGRIHI